MLITLMERSDLGVIPYRNTIDFQVSLERPKKAVRKLYHRSDSVLNRFIVTSRTTCSKSWRRDEEFAVSLIRLAGSFKSHRPGL